MRRVLALVALVAAVAPASAQDRPWPSERPPRPLPARESTFPDYQMRTLENGLQVVTVLHHEQPVISMRMIVRAGAAQDPRDRTGWPTWRRRLPRPGFRRQVGEAGPGRDRLHGRRDGGRRRRRPHLRQRRGDEGQLRGGAAHPVRHGAEAGLRARGDRAAAPAGAVDAARELRPEFVADAVFENRLVYRFNPYGLPQNGTAQSIAAITRETRS